MVLGSQDLATGRAARAPNSRAVAEGGAPPPPPMEVALCGSCCYTRLLFGPPQVLTDVLVEVKKGESAEYDAAEP